MSELKPCPWCGSSNVSLHPWHANLCVANCEECLKTVIAEDVSTGWNALPRTVQAAPSDREKRLESALREIRDKHAMDNEGAGSFISQVNELEDIARAALAGTTTDEVQP